MSPESSVADLIKGFRAAIERVPAVREEGLRYVGQLMRGFSVSQAIELKKRLARRQRTRPVAPCPPRACWVEPELYCRVQSQGWTMATTVLGNSMPNKEQQVGRRTTLPSIFIL
jgi:ATP-dependent DNA ligase